MLTISHEYPQKLVTRDRAITILEILVCLMEELERIFVDVSDGTPDAHESALSRQRKNLKIVMASDALEVSLPSVWVMMAEARETQAICIARVPDYYSSLRQDRIPTRALTELPSEASALI